MSAPLTPEHANVLLDALTALRTAISNGTDAPWDDYESEPEDNDPKATREGYELLMADAHAFLGDMLNRSLDAWLAES